MRPYKYRGHSLLREKLSGVRFENSDPASPSLFDVISADGEDLGQFTNEAEPGKYGHWVFMHDLNGIGIRDAWMVKNAFDRWRKAAKP